jgi:hypothetical protein
MIVILVSKISLKFSIRAGVTDSKRTSGLGGGSSPEKLSIMSVSKFEVRRIKIFLQNDLVALSIR